MKSKFSILTKIICLVLVITHIGTIVLRDASFAAEESAAVADSGAVSASSEAPSSESLAASAESTTTTPETGPGNYAPLANVSAFNVGAMQSFQNDLITGRAITSIPISVPPGRKGVQPSLALGYASGSGNGIYGLGWSLELGSIQRSLKNGMPRYDLTDTFIFNSGGAQVELVPIGGNEYRPAIEGTFMKFAFNGTYWELTDKTGTKYRLGYSVASRQETSQGTYKWCMDKVTDVFGNYLTISYINDAGAIYPNEMVYTGNEVKGDQPMFKVIFDFIPRQDAIVSYRIGARIEINKILSKIRVYNQTNLIRQYVFTYTNTISASLLTSVQAIGNDGVTALPPVQFKYYDNNGAGFSQSSDFAVPLISGQGFTEDGNKDNGVRLVDVNGDGLVDLIHADKNNERGVWLNNGKDFIASADFAIPVINNGGFTESDGDNDNGVRAIDLNSDGFVDLVQADGSGERGVWLNDGKNFVASTDFAIPIIDNGGFTENDGVNDNGVRFADLNGDGLVDLIMADGGAERGAWLNDGHHFVSTTDFVVPVIDNGGFTEKDGLQDNGVRIIDLNGDGLPDLIEADGTTKRSAWLNNGHGFVQTTDFIAPVMGNGGFTENDGYSDNGVSIDDLNGDGLPDLLLADGNSERGVWLNDGHHFVATTDYAVPVITNGGFTESGGDGDNGLRLSDIDGDGLLDLIQADGYDERGVWLNNANGFGLLNEIDNGVGGKIKITYKPSTAYTHNGDDSKSDWAFPVWAVSTVTSEDGLGRSYATNYSYANGYYDCQDREFRGYGYVKVVDVDGNYVEHEFLQDDINKGKLKEKRVYDAQGNLFAKEISTWAHTEPYPGVLYSFLQSSASYVYDGQPVYRYTVAEMEYDQYGNTTRTVSLGEPDNASDDLETITEYVYNLNGYLVSLPKHTKVVDPATSTVLSEKWFYYDGHANINDQPEKGLLTKEEVWGYNPLTNVTDNPVSLFQYDDYGNIINKTDAFGRTITTTYETQLHRYPVSVVNVLGQVVQSTYDFSTGQILSTTDPNNQTTTNIYDALGRIIKVIGPNDSAQYPSIVFDYDLDVFPTKVIKKVNQSYGAANFLTSYAFYDGIGRLIESKSPAEADPSTGQSRQIVSGVVAYDHKGEVKEKYLSYFVNDSPDYVAPTYAQIYINLDYDPVGRVIRTTNPDGTYATAEYFNWSEAVIDENGHMIKRYKDAYNRIIKVEEYRGADGRSPKYPYQPFEVYATTTYEYDKLGNLIKLTDNQGNIAQTWYDSLGRKIKLDDPDMGVWTYEYDKLGNIIKQTDAKAQVLSFTYDLLNRVASKLANGQTVVSYQYDDALKQNCIGRLSKIIDQSGSTEFFYDNLGREIKSVKVVDGSSFTVEKTYDALDRLLTLKYPDGEVVAYAYNPQGIESVTSQTSGKIYVASINYSETGQLLKIEYGNGTHTDYAYNPLTLRLVNLTTQAPFGKIQDLNYEFDSLGNVAGIADYANTASQSFLYDEHDRIVQATGSYGVFGYEYDSIGNLVYKEGTTYTYGQAGKKPHAVTSGSSGFSAVYDANGNMVKRNGQNLEYDAENRLISVTSDAQITLNLKPGWNFISFPFAFTDTKITSVLKDLKYGIDYQQVSRLNSTTGKNEHFVNDSEFNDFDTFEPYRGYQIYINNPQGMVITVTGYSAQGAKTQALKTGDNLVGCPFNRETTVQEAFANLVQGTDYDIIYKYNVDTRQIEELTANLKPGEAYIIHCLRDAAWIPPKEATQTRFVYDGGGGRVKKINGVDYTLYIGSFFEKDSSGSFVKNIFSGSTRICAVDSTGAQYFYHTDHLGSSNVISDASGSQVGFTEFKPYGAISKQNGTYDPKYKFTGKEMDSTGLYYYGARYYDPEIGRFIQADTIVQALYNPQTLNCYSYCNNNPVKYIDPSGHFFWMAAFIGAIIGAMAGGIMAYQNGTSIWKGILGGAISGFGAGFGFGAAAIAWGAMSGAVSAALNGGKIGMGAAMGAFSAVLGGALGGAGSALTSGCQGTMGAVIQAGVQCLGAAITGAVVGGVSSVLNGGKFGDGAGMGAATSAASFALNYAANRVFNNPDNSTKEQIQEDARSGNLQEGIDLARNTLGELGISQASEIISGTAMEPVVTITDLTVEQDSITPVDFFDDPAFLMIGGINPVKGGQAAITAASRSLLKEAGRMYVSTEMKEIAIKASEPFISRLWRGFCAIFGQNIKREAFKIWVPK